MDVDQRILVVDNLDDRRQQLRKMLEARYCSVVEAANCEDALELIEQLDIHLILTETELPTMSGLFLLQKIKQNSTNIEVILLTNNASSFNLLQALRLGAYDFIVRPIDTGEILDKALERVFTHITLRRENALLLQELELQNNNMQHALKLLKALNNSIEQVAAAGDVIEVFKSLLSSALNTVKAKRGFIALLDQKKHQLALKAGAGISADLCKKYSNGIPPGLTTALFDKGEPLLLQGKLPPDYFDLARNTELSDLLASPGLLAAPLTFHEREVGIIVLSGQKEAEFNEHTLHFLIQLAHHACLVLEKTGEIYLLKKKMNGSQK
jgi:CheY-like chemotaxis protein